MQFIKATETFNTFEQSVPAPYIRKSFFSDKTAEGTLRIAACGFYELYFNGERLTKGFLAPYISNPKDIVYYDEYTLTISEGENVIGIMLGNGFQNNPGGYIWDFDKATFRSAPSAALLLRYTSADGTETVIESDTSFRTHPSAIRSDDYRFGEHFDGRAVICGWNQKGFDDSAWDYAIPAEQPLGELRLCTAEPLTVECEMKPVHIFPEDDGFIYDFGVSHAGVCRLSVNGYAGQKIEMQHTDLLKDGKFFIKNLWFDRPTWARDKEIVHKDSYICRGDGPEIYTPTFTYHGFRYVKVTGITPEQATEDLLTFVVFHSDLKSRGGFSCSDETLNRLQEITRRSDLSNFHYFPTDCPHREKNGWTADAALSCEHVLLNFSPEKSYREWQRNICKAQREDGALPGIIPTDGWGFKWGNGPAWDCILAYLPYYTYIYRGETEMIGESADTFIAYLRYLTTRVDEKGLMHIGLGDWCHVSGVRPPKAPLEVTDTIMSMDIAEKIAFLFDVIGRAEERDFARDLADKFRSSFREHLIDFDTMTVAGCCQSSQAMALHYGIFKPEEEEKAFAVLLELIHREDDHMDVGVLGARVIFHVLSRFGHSELAYRMITRPDYPSYGNWLARGATTLWENFDPDFVSSPNHHFWGDISAWFIKNLAGIRYNPTGRNINSVQIAPSFVPALQNARGFYDSPCGKIISAWAREDSAVKLTLSIPEGMSAHAVLPAGFVFEDGTAEKDVQSGVYALRVE